MEAPTVHCPHDRMVPLSELKPNPKNRNSHPDDQIARLAKILAYQGFRYPVKVSKRSGFVTSGHGRIEAARLNGWTQVPVSFQDYATDEQEYADLTADNAIASWSELDLSGVNADLPDFGPELDIEMLGIRDFILEPIEKLEPQCDEDAAPEHVEPRTKLGDVYQLGRHRLMCGDSTSIDAVEKLMAGEKADMVWTDPPYNVAYQGGNHGDPSRTDGLRIENDSMDDETFYKFLYDVYLNLFVSTSPGGAIYVAHADTEGVNFRKAMKDAGWLLKQCLVWVKSSLVMGRQDYHWKHEPILYGWAPGSAHNWYSDRKQTTVLSFDRPSRNGEHPTMKPVELVEYCLGNSSKAGDIVLDLFGGSGTTLIASEKIGRRARLMELDPKYCDVIVARWEKYTGKQAVLLTPEQDADGAA